MRRIALAALATSAVTVLPAPAEATTCGGTGRTYATELTERIIKPPGLRDTYDPGDSEHIRGPHPRSYTLVERNGKPVRVDGTVWNMSFGGAGGALISTPADLNRFFEAKLPLLRQPGPRPPTGGCGGLRHRAGLLRYRPQLRSPPPRMTSRGELLAAPPGAVPTGHRDAEPTRAVGIRAPMNNPAW